MNTALIELLAAIVSIFATGGIGYGLLHYHRDEAAHIIAQHGVILTDMKTIYEAMKKERDEAHDEIIGLRRSLHSAEGLIETLQAEIRSLTKELREHTNGA